jgi:hypothetical protein
LNISSFVLNNLRAAKLYYWFMNVFILFMLIYILSMFLNDLYVIYNGDSVVASYSHSEPTDVDAVKWYYCYQDICGGLYRNATATQLPDPNVGAYYLNAQKRIFLGGFGDLFFQLFMNIVIMMPWILINFYIWNLFKRRNSKFEK